MAPPDPNDVLKILVSTDNHVGFKENDRVRGDDTFTTLEEIFQIAKSEKVDLLLFGGDLFNSNRPSRRTMVKVMRLFRKYCMGSGAINFTIISDPLVTFGKGINYEDANCNVSLPVFGIHGNHDEPMTEVVDDTAFCPMDILAEANLLNYFGKTSLHDDVVIQPILIKKGASFIALYGLGYTSDERLSRLFAEGKVGFARPAAREKKGEKWFHLLVLHQNRAGAGRVPSKSCIDETSLPKFINLVIWGHEHECLLKPVSTRPWGETCVEEITKSKAQLCISQPGSSVVTALIEGEAIPKKVGVLEICGRMFRMPQVLLSTVRPFRFRQERLEHHEAFCAKVMANRQCLGEEMIKLVGGWIEKEVESARQEADDTELLPIIRVKVFTGSIGRPPPLTAQTLGRRFQQIVANPEDLVIFSKSVSKRRPGMPRRPTDQPSLQEALSSRAPEIGGVELSDVVATLLQDANLLCYTKEKLVSAIQAFTTKQQNTAISDLVDKSLRDTCTALQESGKRYKTPEEIMEAIAELHDAEVAKETRAADSLDRAMEAVAPLAAVDEDGEDWGGLLEEESDDDEEEEPRPKPVRKRPRAAAPKKQVKKKKEEDEPIDSSSSEPDSPPPQKKRRTAAAKKVQPKLGLRKRGKK